MQSLSNERQHTQLLNDPVKTTQRKAWFHTKKGMETASACAACSIE